MRTTIPLPAMLAGPLLVILAGCTPPPRPGEGTDARAEIEARYAALAEAIRRDDLEDILSFQAPDFTSRNPNGQSFDYAAMAEYTRRMVAMVDSVIHIRNVVREFTARGDTAVADVCQEFSRLQQVGGQQRRVDTSALQTETWVRHPQGWLRSRVENVRGTRWFVDGKRVDATQPYRPDAPEYAPTNEPPTGCGLR